MPVEILTYAALADRLKISPEAARALAKRHRLPRSRSNDGKTLVTVDLAEIQHTPLPARSSGGDRAVTATLNERITALQAELAKLETTSAGHRADYERERDRAESLMAELLRLTGEAMTAKETAARVEGELMAWQASTARLEGELTALRSRSWWQRLAG